MASDTHDTLFKVDRQIAQAEYLIDLLLSDIEMGDLNMKARLDCAIKMMNIYQRLLLMRERCEKDGAGGMSEAERAQQAALADIMRLLEDECSEERGWRAPGMSEVE